MVISEDQGQFKFGSAALPEAVQQRIDQMIADLKANPRGNFVEIEGHTDSSGDKMVNQRIGEARAEAVKRYLYETHQVPLHKMNVISWGEDKPVSPNNTKRRTRPESPSGYSRPRVRLDTRAKGREQRAPVPSAPSPCPLLPYPYLVTIPRSPQPLPIPLYPDTPCVCLLSKMTPRPGAA